MDTLHHKRANFQCEIPHILGSGQKTNRTNFRRFEICTVHASRSAHFSLLLRLEYHVFVFKILHTGGGNHCLHPDIFFWNYFETLNLIFFLKSSKRSTWCPGAIFAALTYYVLYNFLSNMISIYFLFSHLYINYLLWLGSITNPENT